MKKSSWPFDLNRRKGEHLGKGESVQDEIVPVLWPFWSSQLYTITYSVIEIVLLTSLRKPLNNQETGAEAGL